MLDHLRPHWPLVALLVSGALLAGAHAFESFGHLAPCTMCLSQREWHWGVAGVALAALVAKPETRWAAFVLALAYLGSTLMASWHVAVEQKWLPATCEASTDLSNIRPLDFNSHEVFQIPHCDTPQWNLLGITMAGYNAIVSLAMAGASLLVAFAGERKP